MFGDVVSYEAGAGQTPAVVRFSTHDAALAAKRAASTLTSLCAGIDTLYNERSYDGRHGAEGLDNDHGRGWCAEQRMSFPPSFSSTQPGAPVLLYVIPEMCE